MEEVTKIKEMAFTVIESIINFAQMIFTVANSTIGELIGRISLEDDSPEWLKMLINRMQKIIEEIPIVGDNTLIELMLGSGVIIIITFAIIKFFIPIS